MNYFFGFSYWKHDFVRPFFLDKENIIFINPFFYKNTFKLALKKGLNKNSNIYIWGRKNYPEVQEYAREHALNIYRVEDGFIRSVSLGSDLTQPYSLVVDSRGIYFDSTVTSDLEYILNTASFDDEILKRAKRLTSCILEKKLSKYNLYENKKLDVPSKKKIVLVPGQVDDDASIQYGADGMTNLELLKATRTKVEDAYIIYKSHPDVLSGNRVGSIDEKKALEYADIVVTKIGLDSVLEVCDEVHTMTSLVGFEALMRNKKVYTYGLPFYAGWGLSIDENIIERRQRKLSLEELVAGVMLIYPKYINPLTKKRCEVEELLQAIEEEKKVYNTSKIYKLKLNIRNFLSRKIQLLLRLVSLNR